MEQADKLEISQFLSHACSDVNSGSGMNVTANSSEQLPEGFVEEKFRVDRRKLEAMILGCLPDPWDTQITKIPISCDGRVMSADEFFQTIMELTNTEIRYPKFLKIGGRSKKDPYVRIIGLPKGVHDATRRVQQDLQPSNKITLKMDVPWTGHSHIIGKSGNTIQPVVKKTGVSIHFPDGNKNSEVHKSNQVSINSRGEELSGLEEARAAIRDLTPLIYSFSFPATTPFTIGLASMDLSILITHVQHTYNVQADLQVFYERTPMIFGSIKGTEWDAGRVREATLYILQNICGKLAVQIIVQMKIEISPQHHSFIIGRNSESLNKIMHITSTKIVFPQVDGIDSIPPLDRYTILISGSIFNVYLAKQNLLGSLPLVLMFDLLPDQHANQMEMDQIMQTLNVTIVARSKRADGRRSLILRCTERNASNLYEAWRLLTKMEKPIVKAKIPQSYRIVDTIPFFEVGFNNPFLSRDISLMRDANESVKSLKEQYFMANDNTFWHGTTGCTSNNTDEEFKISFGNRSVFKNGMPVKECSTEESSNQRSCDYCSNHSCNSASRIEPITQIEEFESIVNLIPDRRAPGCEKKHLESNPKHESDYFSQRILATKAMKEPVTQMPRTPTSNWSGQGFSKSTPGFVLNQLKKEKYSEREKWDYWNHGSADESLNSSSNNSLGLYERRTQLVASTKTQINMTASDYIEAMMCKGLDFSENASSDLDSLLTHLQLEQYIDLFSFHGIDLQTFKNLTDQNLKDFGVVLFGHRKKLLMAIKSTNF